MYLSEILLIEFCICHTANLKTVYSKQCLLKKQPIYKRTDVVMKQRKFPFLTLMLICGDTFSSVLVKEKPPAALPNSLLWPTSGKGFNQNHFPKLGQYTQPFTY